MCCPTFSLDGLQQNKLNYGNDPNIILGQVFAITLRCMFGGIYLNMNLKNQVFTFHEGEQG